MKILSCLLTFLLIMSGCSNQNDALDGVLLIRSRLNKSGCEFFAHITADYDTYTYSFQMACHMDENGNMNFEVKAPETLCGITGAFDCDGGKLTFDDKVLAFSPLSEGLLSPVAAPWVFLTALKGGYINGGGYNGDGYRVQINDTYEAHALMVDIQTDSDSLPRHADIYWEGKRITALSVENFRIL